jgi:hypothetical protein
LEPPLEFFQVAQGKGLHLHISFVVVSTPLPRSDGKIQGELECGAGLLQRVHLMDDALFGPGLNPVPTCQRVEDHTGAPFEPPMDVVEQTVFPELDQDSDSEREAGMDGLQQASVVQEAPDYYDRFSGF